MKTAESQSAEPHRRPRSCFAARGPVLLRAVLLLYAAVFARAQGPSEQQPHTAIQPPDVTATATVTGSVRCV